MVQDISRVLGTREGLCYLVPLMAQSQRDRYKPSELRRDLRENLKLATTVLMVFRTGPAGEVHEQLHEYEQVFTKRRDRTPGLDVWHLGDQPLGFHLPGMRVHRVTDGDIARALLVDIGEGVHEAHIPSLACYEVLGVLSRHLSTQAEIGKHLSSLFDLIDSGAIRSHSVEQNLW